MKASSLTALAAHVAVAYTQYPTNVEIDLVFPLSKTYNIAQDFPVVFAVQNADPFLTWSPFFSWQVTPANGSASDSDSKGSKAFSGVLPPDIVDGIFFVSSSAGKSTKLAPGEYVMTWNLSVSACTNNGRLKSVESKVFLNGFMTFSAVSDGSGTDDDFTAECPEYQGSLVSQGTEMDGDALLCPYVERYEDPKANPCRSTMWETMADCVNHNLTNFGTEDFGPCQKAIDDAPKDLGAGPTVEGTQKNDTEGGQQGGDEGTGSLYGVSSFGLSAVVAIAMM